VNYLTNSQQENIYTFEIATCDFNLDDGMYNHAIHLNGISIRWKFQMDNQDKLRSVETCVAEKNWRGNEQAQVNSSVRNS